MNTELSITADKTEKKIFVVPPEGDMNYICLTPYQAKYLMDELTRTMKFMNELNDFDTIVLPFPKNETDND